MPVPIYWDAHKGLHYGSTRITPIKGYTTNEEKLCPLTVEREKGE